VGVPQTFEITTQIIRPGGTVTIVGARPVGGPEALRACGSKDIGLTMGLVSTTTLTTAMQLKFAQERRAAEKCVSRRFMFETILEPWHKTRVASQRGRPSR
jgi:alcohol dehydrogenase